VQAALLRVVLERTVGDLSLPADVAVVAAANPPEQAADGWDLSNLPHQPTIG
jgi:MoxR-like ATPase